MIFFLFLSACSSASASQTTTSTDPDQFGNYYLVTSNPVPTSTPFQPVTPTLSADLSGQSLPSPYPTFTTIPAVSTTPVVELSTLSPVTPTLQPEIVSTDNPTPLPPDPVVIPAVNRPQYYITALMDYDGHTLSVSENVVYPNQSDSPMNSISLAVNSNLWSGVFVLQSIMVNDQSSANYSLGGQWLTVNLDTALQPGQAVKIGIGYLLNLPYSSAKFENFGYTSRQSNLIDWYPFVPPFINGQWVLPDPYMYGENLVYDKADFHINLSFTDPANAPVIAASAPGISENGGLVYNLENARNFTISASPYFLVSQADANGVTVYNYYFSGDDSAAAMVLELTRMAVNTYSLEFGQYPHTSLSVCETDLNDGLETDGLYFLASNFYAAYNGTVKNNLSIIAVHETAHQWWYGAVANNQAVEPWLDEAMATYSEHVFYEDNYPDLVNWWWGFRVNWHSPSGWVDSRVYDTSSFTSYINAVYFNGAYFIQELRDRAGSPAFFQFLRYYYDFYNGRIVTTNDFLSTYQQVTGANISDLVKKYFYYH
ncbi:MAG: M1 family aminopeptidase [Chloroflexota bacterium]